MLPQRIPIGGRISYWKASEDPLSADIGVVEGKSLTWVFDVGNGPRAAECLQSLGGPKRAVLSHFHQDHIGSLQAAEFETVYQGACTFRHTGAGEIVRELLFLEDGAIRLFPIPSSHAKDCIGMEVDGTYAFLGDAVYSTSRGGRPCYNATLLHDTIRTLEGLSAPYFLLSHGEPFVRRKEEVLEELRTIYAQRARGEAYINL